MEDKITRAMQNNRSEVARQVAGRSRRVWLRTLAGVYFDYAYAAPLEVERVNEIFTTMARGIYFKLARTRFPDGYELQVRRVLPHNAALMFDTLKGAGMRGPYLIGVVVLGIIGLYVFGTMLGGS